jgi:predicted RND superfamily exporter protein
MTDLLAGFAVLAAQGAQGDPNGTSGVLVIVGIVLALAVGAFLLHAAFQRFGRSKQRAMERHPAPDGRVGRVSEFRDR